MKSSFEIKDRTKRVKPNGCSVFFALFLLPFATVGIVISCLNYYRTVEWVGMQSWDEVPATLNEVKLVESNSDDSTSHSLEVQYEYEYDGANYHGDRASIYAGSDNIGSFQSTWFKKLKPLKGVKDGIVCYVCPSEPEASVLIREARWEMQVFFSMFALIFGLAGVIGIFAVISSSRENRFVQKRKRVSPHEPWLWKPQWMGDEIVPEDRSWRGTSRLVVGWIVMAVLPATIFCVIAGIGGDWWAFAGLILPATALLVAAVMVWRMRRNMRPGKARLKLSATPVEPGVPVMAAVVFECVTQPDDDPEYELVCTEFSKSNEPNEDSDFVEVYKHEEQISCKDCVVINGQLCIPVAIQVPLHGRESTFDELDVNWKLSLKLPIGGRKVSRSFVIPVFRTNS
ncbi:MAG: DUF3592 domain-containing protein [Planctomycetota bacterium]